MENTIQEDIKTAIDMGYSVKIIPAPKKNIEVEVRWTEKTAISEIIPYPSSIYDGKLQKSIEWCTNELSKNITSNA